MIIKEALLSLFYLLLFNFLIYRFAKFQFRNLKPFVTSALFNLKFLVGIFIWVIYTFYYKDVQNNDVHKFYNDALILRDVAAESPKDFVMIILGVGGNDEHLEKYYSQLKNWRRNFDEAPFNENQTIIKLNALLMFFSFKTYFVHILFMCFISLIGWVLLANALMRYADTRNSIFIIPVMLLPSVLFWTSGVMKEPLLVFGLGILLHVILNAEWFSIGRLTMLVAGFYIILLTKFFVLVCMVPAFIASYILPKNKNPKLIFAKYAIANILLLAVAFNFKYIVPKVDLQQILVNKQSNSIKEANYFAAGSRIEIPVMQPGAVSIVSAAPVSVWNTLMRPYLWEGRNIMMLASALENIVLVLLLIAFLLISDYKHPRNLNLFFFFINFSIVYFALIGMCTPVLGNLVRYRAPILPVLLFAFFLNMKPKTIPAKLQFLFRIS